MSKFEWGFRRWTRHSLVLVIAGMIYVAIGVAFFFAPPLLNKDPSLKIALQWLSLTGWGVVFIVIGVASMISSFWPMGAEKWGYTGLTGLSAAWCAFYFMAVFLTHAPKLALISSLTWGLLAFIWWAVSGLISPEFIKTVIDDEPD